MLPRLLSPGGAALCNGGVPAAAAAASGAGSPSGARAQDVQQPPRWQQQRWQSALPQPAYGSEDEQSDGSMQPDHRRRLREMQEGSGASSSSGRSSGSVTQPPQGRPSWPSVEEAAAQLRRSGGGGGCSSLSPTGFASSALPAPAGEPGSDSSSNGGTLDWREVVQMARASQLQLSGDQVLTDTFG